MEKIVIIIKHAEDEPDFCIIPMMMAVKAGSSGLHPVVVLQSRAVSIAMKGFASAVEDPKMAPLNDLIDSFIQSDGRLLVSSPSLKKNGISNDELIEGATVVNTATVIREIQDSKHVISY